MRQGLGKWLATAALVPGTVLAYSWAKPADQDDRSDKAAPSSRPAKPHRLELPSPRLSLGTPIFGNWQTPEPDAALRLAGHEPEAQPQFALPRFEAEQQSPAGAEFKAAPPSTPLPLIAPQDGLQRLAKVDQAPLGEHPLAKPEAIDAAPVLAAVEPAPALPVAVAAPLPVEPVAISAPQLVTAKPTLPAVIAGPFPEFALAEKVPVLEMPAAAMAELFPSVPELAAIEPLAAVPVPPEQAAIRTLPEVAVGAASPVPAISAAPAQPIAPATAMTPVRHADMRAPTPTAVVALALPNTEVTAQLPVPTSPQEVAKTNAAFDAAITAKSEIAALTRTEPRAGLIPAVYRSEAASAVQSRIAAERAAFEAAKIEPRQAANLNSQRNNLVQTTSAKTIVVDPGRLGIGNIPSPLFGRTEPGMGQPQASADNIGKATNLAQAIAYSYETNPQLLSGRASTRSADYLYPATRAAYGPRIDASASYIFARDRFEDFPGIYSGAQGFTSTASLIISQPLFTFGRNKAAERDALSNIEYRREVLRLTQNDVLLGVVAGYVGVLREAGAVTIARENVALLEREDIDSSERFKVREITSTDLQQVQTRLQLGRTVLLNAQAQLGATQASFLRYVGMPPGELAPPVSLPIPVATLGEAYAIGDTESPLIRAANAREKVSRAAVAAAQAERLPRVDLQGTADYGTLSPYSSSLRTNRLRGQVTLTVPLIDSGARSAQVKLASEANQADWRLIEAAARDTRVSIATAWNQLAAAQASLDRFRSASETALSAYQGAVLQERAGARTTLDVLDLARDLLTVRNSYNEALANEYLARANLLAAMGKLDPEVFSPGLKLYDPAVHFRAVQGHGDVPLVTSTLSAIDGVTTRNLSKDRPSQDAAALTATEATVD